MGEADRTLDMGFRPQVDRIVDLIAADRQTMFFSATLEGMAGRLAAAYARDPVQHEVQDGTRVVAEADHGFISIDEQRKLERLIATLEEERELALVFVATKRGADRLRMKLGAKG